ncbi:hypothetical protein Cfor_07812, partial [Coptotermes formosanus]
EDFYKNLDGERYGGIYAFSIPMFIVRDPDIIKNILVKDFPSFHDRGFFSDEEMEPLTGHLFLLSGMRFGLMQTKVGLISLLSKYQFSVSKKTAIPLVFDTKTFLMAPVGGMWLQIRKR